LSSVSVYVTNICVHVRKTKWCELIFCC
jgi:hypothetical protein